MIDWLARQRTLCTCPHGIRSLGRLYGVNMGKGEVRLSTARDCPVHNEHEFVGNGERCQQCASRRVAWIHPETRRRLP